MTEIELPITFYRRADNDPKFIESLKYMLSRGAFAGDFLITFGKHLSFLKDQKFVKCLKEHPEKEALTIAWRLHTSCWAAQNALDIGGDFIQCGVQDAVTSTMIIKYLDFKKADKNFYLYDTFSGIPTEYLSDETRHLDHAEYKKSGTYEKILGRFSSYPNVKVIKGKLPGKLKEICPAKISFIHMNLSNFPSERDTLKYVIDRVADGGIILFEGFGFEHYKVWKIAEEDFVKRLNLTFLELPTGQGITIVRKGKPE